MINQISIGKSKRLREKKMLYKVIENPTRNINPVAIVRADNITQAKIKVAKKFKVDIKDIVTSMSLEKTKRKKYGIYKLNVEFLR